MTSVSGARGSLYSFSQVGEFSTPVEHRRAEDDEPEPHKQAERTLPDPGVRYHQCTSWPWPMDQILSTTRLNPTPTT